MEHFNLRKYRGPETWAKVREAYLAGETGPVVAKRFDVGLANLRKRAMEEGWTRRRYAVQTDAAGKRRLKAVRPAEAAPAAEPPPQAAPALAPATADPQTAVAAAVSQAAALLSAGRSAEATAMLRAADQLARLAGVPPEPPPPVVERVEVDQDVRGDDAGRARGVLGNAPVVRRCHERRRPGALRDRHGRVRVARRPIVNRQSVRAAEPSPPS
jgi:hypothetical protein